MKYMLLIYDQEQSWAKLSAADQEKMMAEYMAFTQDLRTRGIWQSSSQLQPVATAKSLQVRNGERVVTDGPFAETREQLGGYYLVEAASMEEALELASKIPSARLGTIEVRPLVERPMPAAQGA